MLMKKTLLFLSFVGLAISANSEEITYNFFDPEDCDEYGWLWLDSQEKIDKYVGSLSSDKKIKLVNAQYEKENPDFPGEYITPESYTDPELKGYNQLGEEGGEGSVTGGIVLPEAKYNEEDDYWPTDGGGILIAMPDCAIFDLYISQSQPSVYTEIYVARMETNDPGDCSYVYDDDEYYNWSTGEYEGGPVITDYAGPYLNMQAYEYDYDYGEGSPDIYSIYGSKGNPRTAYIANYTYDPVCPMYIQGLRIRTFTSVSADTEGAGVNALEQDSQNVVVKDGLVTVAKAALIEVYSPSGAKVASEYGTSLDCSGLKGIYLVKVGNKTVKAVF